MTNFALTDGTLYFGTKWELFNNSPRRPRSAMVPIDEATILFSDAAAEEEARRCRDILGITVRPVPVTIERVKTDKGTETRVRPA